MSAADCMIAISNRIAACEDHGYVPTRIVVGLPASRELATALPLTTTRNGRPRGCGIGYEHRGAVITVEAQEALGDRVAVVGVHRTGKPWVAEFS